MKKTIPFPIAIIIIVLFTFLVGGYTIYQHWLLLGELSIVPVSFPLPTKKALSEDQTPELTEKEQACIDSGGTVTTSMCCKNTDDFPNFCIIGPCGCSPENSHEVKICDCGLDKCFDGTECVSP